MKKRLNTQLVNNANHIGLLVLRVFLGLTMLLGHGLSKGQVLFSNTEVQFPDPIGVGEVASLALAVFSEVICSFILTLGLLTRWVLLPLIVTMFTAAFIIHGADDFGTKEKALLYGVGYITLFFTGPGKYSIDTIVKK